MSRVSFCLDGENEIYDALSRFTINLPKATINDDIYFHAIKTKPCFVGKRTTGPIIH